MEVWDLYTKYREPMGRTHIRGQVIGEELFHITVHVWIRNSRGEYLMSQRASDRPLYPCLWECPGGSVLAGETSICGAVREVKEEVGIDLSPENGRLLFTKIRGVMDGVPYHDIKDVWLFDCNSEADLSRASTAEVSRCRFMKPDEIEKLIEAGECVPVLRYFPFAWKDGLLDSDCFGGITEKNEAAEPGDTAGVRGAAESGGTVRENEAVESGGAARVNASVEPEGIVGISGVGEPGSTVGVSSADRRKKANYRNIIGKTVSGKIDCPMGSRHPRHPEILYPVNYGYVEEILSCGSDSPEEKVSCGGDSLEGKISCGGDSLEEKVSCSGDSPEEKVSCGGDSLKGKILGGDGEAQDVYVLGMSGPAKRFTGHVAAVYHRFDDAEDKWIVTADGQDFTDDQILGEIYFQEQYYNGKLYR